MPPITAEARSYTHGEIVNNRRLLTPIALIAVAGLTLGACSNSGTDSAGTSGSVSASAASGSAAAPSGTVTVTDNHGTVEVPVPAERVVALDNRSFEILSNWGIDLVAAPKPLIPATVSAYKDNPDIVDLGSHNEPNLEALVAAQPDLIISGQRFRRHYEDIKTLNPDAAIVEMEPREDQKLDEELKRHVTLLGEIFGKQAEATAMIEEFDAAVARAKAAYNGTDTVMAVNVSGGEIGYVAPGVGRTYGPVFEMLGLTPALNVEGASSNHEGDDISVEAIAESNPDWIFVLDRDAAVKAEEGGYTPALDVISQSAALQNVAAVTEGRLVLAPADTYVNESIITYTEILNEIATAFENAKG